MTKVGDGLQTLNHPVQSGAPQDFSGVVPRLDCGAHPLRRAEAHECAKSHAQPVIPVGPAATSRVSSALPMKAESTNLKQFLEAVLRGAAKIFG